MTDEDVKQEVETQEPEAAAEAEFKARGKAGKPAAPRTKFRKVNARAYEAGTTRTVEHGLVITDS